MMHNAARLLCGMAAEMQTKAPLGKPELYHAGIYTTSEIGNDCFL